MKRRVDASMDLLRVTRETALDPGYRKAKPAPEWMRFITWLLLVIAGIMFAISGAETTEGNLQNVKEREELIKRVERERTREAGLREELAKVDAEIRELRESLVKNPAVNAELESLEPQVGTQAVQGPGVIVTVDDAENANTPAQLVSDRDIRHLVNGLWQSGAEAIAINGHRLSSRTAIRNAGSAITVDYSSLVGPYEIKAIGDPDNLADSFGKTAGAARWESLQLKYGLKFEIAETNNITIEADPGLGLTRAVTNKKE
ncbi:MAG: hypothetical protein CR979_00395 [Propionibacterium sp.]|nr:MAG: hypothetical protein CR979_00395 [Propionibacterium sp.]